MPDSLATTNRVGLKALELVPDPVSSKAQLVSLARRLDQDGKVEEVMHMLANVALTGSCDTTSEILMPEDKLDDKARVAAASAFVARWIDLSKLELAATQGSAGKKLEQIRHVIEDRVPDIEVPEGDIDD